MMNNEMMNGTVNAAEVNAIVQNVATTTEMTSLMLMLECLSVLDEENQRLFVEQLCKAASSVEDAIIPVESDEMELSYKTAVSCINDLIGTSEECFYDTLVKAEQCIRSLNCLDENDNIVIDLSCPYIYMVYERDGIEKTKKLLGTIKVYLSTVYDFIKNNVEQ